MQAKTAGFIGVDPLEDRPKKVKGKVLLLPAGMSKKPSARTRSLKLSEITTSLPPEQKSSLMLKAAQRIMNSEKAAYIGGIPSVRTKVISTLGARFSIMSNPHWSPTFFKISLNELTLLFHGYTRSIVSTRVFIRIPQFCAEEVKMTVNIIGNLLRGIDSKTISS